MSSQQKSLLIDSPTQLEGVASLAGAKRSLADDATESNGIVVTNDVIANKFAVVASEGAENADENANVESESIDNVRVHKKSKHLDEPHQQVTIDVEDEKDTFVQQSTQLKHDALDIKEQTEATLDKLNEVHYELVKNTNALLSAVDPNLNATINETEERIKAVEELAANADNAAQAVAAEAQPVMAVAVVEAETTTGVVAEAPQESKNEAAPIEPTTTNE